MTAKHATPLFQYSSRYFVVVERGVPSICFDSYTVFNSVDKKAPTAPQYRDQNTKKSGKSQQVVNDCSDLYYTIQEEKNNNILCVHFERLLLHLMTFSATPM